jgi:Na+-transporting NADH:ubiquinone oxidoreductase subunit NqrB
MDNHLIVVGKCTRVYQVSFKHKVDTRQFVSTVLNCLIVLVFVLSLSNIIEICIGKIR